MFCRLSVIIENPAPSEKKSHRKFSSCTRALGRGRRNVQKKRDARAGVVVLVIKPVALLASTLPSLSWLREL